ncbi:hypothetical protein HYS97_00685 [Candidatus Daviesbacteria bacterium]|nr:hypothetical protein [Candidatus Daviesbacteria bacterium]
MNYLEARHNLPVPINIRFTKGISDHLVTATFDGIEDLVAASGQNREITGFRTKKLDLANLLQAETYVLRAFEMYGHGQDKGYGPQAPIQGIISSVNDSPEREKPQWLILVINEPLRDAVSGDFGFAATDPIYLVSVLSTFGIERELEDTHMQMAVMRRFARHEGGHLFKITKMIGNFGQAFFLSISPVHTDGLHT